MAQFDELTKAFWVTIALDVKHGNSTREHWLKDAEAFRQLTAKLFPYPPPRVFNRL